MSERAQRRPHPAPRHTVGADAEGAQISPAARQAGARDTTGEYLYWKKLSWLQYPYCSGRHYWT